MQNSKVPETQHAGTLTRMALPVLLILLSDVQTPLKKNPENQSGHCKKIQQNTRGSKMKTGFLQIKCNTMLDSKEYATSLLPHPPLKELQMSDV